MGGEDALYEVLVEVFHKDVQGTVVKEVSKIGSGMQQGSMGKEYG